MGGLRGKIKPLAMGAIISCRAVIKDAKWVCRGSLAADIYSFKTYVRT